MRNGEGCERAKDAAHAVEKREEEEEGVWTLMMESSCWAEMEVCDGMCKTLAGAGCYVGVVRRKTDLGELKANEIRRQCTTERFIQSIRRRFLWHVHKHFI